MNLHKWATATALIALISTAAPAQTALHGSADAFAAPGVAMAWAVARGATEGETNVVLRIVTDPAVFASLAVIGVDPFTKAEKVWRAAATSPGLVEVRIPRAQFADFPRTEVRLVGKESTSAGRAPAVIVFYLGVPDTTPEFADARKLDTYLADRLARVRAVGAK